MLNDPEKELQEFLDSKPEWVRVALEKGDSHVTRQNIFQWFDLLEAGLAEQYQQILERIPTKWKKYCERMRRQYGTDSILVPKGKPGRPRKDALAQQAVALQKRGMNFPQVAAELNKRHGEGTTTPAAVPKLIKRFLARTKSSA